MPTRTRKAVVTGAASGLGRAIALRLAQDGWEIAVADLDPVGGEETARQVQAAGGSGWFESLDVANLAAWEQLSTRLHDRWDHLDLIVNNAGVCGAGNVGEFPISDWQWLLSINLYGVIHGCHTFVPWLKQNPQGGHVINTASIAAFLAAPTMGAYNVAKAGVLALSETMYTELAPLGVGVTVLCPGFFQTGLLKQGRFAVEASRKVAQDYMRRSSFTAETVANAAIRAMQRKKLYVIEGARARWLWRFRRWMPMSLLRLISAGSQRQMRRKTPSQPAPLPRD